MDSKVSYRLEADGRIFCISINDPKQLNSLSFQDFNRIGQLLEQADNDEQVLVTILQSTGRFFSAGGKVGDVQKMELEVSEHPERLLGRLADPNVYLVNTFAKHRKLLICCLNGPAVGMTASLVMLCDVLYAKNDSVYLLFPFTSLGFVPEGGSSVTLPWKLGINTAYEHLVFSTPISLEELMNTGTVIRNYTIEDTDQFNARVIDDVKKALPQMQMQSLLGIKNLLKSQKEQTWLLKAQAAETNETLPFWSSGEPFQRFRELQKGSRRHKL
ncbi:DCI1 (YOR180C) [Zygosaccharomyces parabailii]|nr:DCI1 (YOR180C) [Zygosaccharomyces parabailii]CDH11876.1 related to Delta(3,5)-Delta(2,4)-dienoyl-CoA isomerase [Zygosaccharomyces bailii ISA1307]